MDIDGWLREIGLEQYAQTFRDNAINADVLCKAIGEYRKLAEDADDPMIKQELLELADICDKVANNIEDHMTAG